MLFIKHMTITGKIRAALCLWLFAASAGAAAQDVKSSREDAGITVVVGAPYIELYTQPGRGFPRFHAVEKYEQLLIRKRRNDWFKVETEDGKTGWVRKRDLTNLYDLEGKPLAFPSHQIGDTDFPWQVGLLWGETEGTIGYTLFAGYRFTPNISTELKYAQSFGAASTVKVASLMLVHQPFPKWRVSPFFSLGGGVLDTAPEAVLVTAEDRQDTALTVGGGLSVYITHRILARVEYSKHTVLTTREFNEEVEEWKAGFSVLF